ncbi:MAG: hypothetical protein LBF08_04700 [Dysgonamonadaceae bacterium]|jgi:predicted Zn-dependent protease|nr:hypothetical protein [Dysgonamonadaceae bacterium]
MEKIIKLMQGKAKYEKRTLSHLSKIIRKYPYFQLAHLLYAMTLFHRKDERFSSELQKTAAYLNDRKQLFFWIESRFFDAAKLEALRKETPKNADFFFKRIDAFLAKQGEMPKKLQDAPAVSVDYVKSFLSENREETKPTQFQNAIDDFLEKDISSIKIEWVDPNELVDEPVDEPEQLDDEDFATETMAKIFIKQRKYEKALDIIRKIVLRYPEKFSYFADRIQMLEDLTIYKQ